MEILHDCVDCKGHPSMFFDLIGEIVFFTIKCCIFVTIVYACIASVSQSAMIWIQKMPPQCQQIVIDSFKKSI